MSAWLAPAQRLHARLAAMAVAVACLAALSPPDLPAQAAVLLAGVVLVGMPHGAFDPLVAARVLRPRLGRMWWAPFLGFYLALAGLVMLGWAGTPGVVVCGCSVGGSGWPAGGGGVAGPGRSPLQALSSSEVASRVAILFMGGS